MQSERPGTISQIHQSPRSLRALCVSVVNSFALRRLPIFLRLVLVLHEKSRKIPPQNRPNSFRMNNFLVIVLDNRIRIITLQKQWGRGKMPVFIALSGSNSLRINQLAFETVF